MCCCNSRGCSNGNRLYRFDTLYQSVLAYLFWQQPEVILCRLFGLKWRLKPNTGSPRCSTEHLSQTNRWLIWICNTFWLHQFPIISSPPVRASSPIPHLLLVSFWPVRGNVLHKCRMAAQVLYKKKKKKERNPLRPFNLVMNSQLFELFLARGRGDKYG